MLLATFSSFSQIKKRQAIRITLVGDHYFAAEAYNLAIRYYQVAFTEYPEYVKAQYQMAQCYRLTQQYDSAEHHYNLIITDEQDFRYPLSRFHLAMLQLEDDNREAALENFEAFRNLLVKNEQHELKKFNKYYLQAKEEIDNIKLR
ncbi:tetratricopeptide repeat protein [Ekhidna sp.]|uniref:tetratricopeptide repeat protein n=1 Tax=Ekhidna sp. TaxID=2608089 RepID=UPI00329A14A8